MRAKLALCAGSAALAGLLFGQLAHTVTGDASARPTARSAEQSGQPGNGRRAGPPAGATARGRGSAAPRDGAAGAPRNRRRHVALNMKQADWPRAAALGYDLFDVGPDPDSLAALPPGAKGLIWVGNSTCSDFTLSFRRFRAAVRRLADDRRVYGWYLSDEPNPAECPDVVPQIRRRAVHLHRHAPRQKAFATLTDWPMRSLADARLDLIGLDPYPCRRGADRCELRAIDRMVAQARAAGFRRRQIVPVYQTFGQRCAAGDRTWRLPRAAELRAMMRRWHRLVPAPRFDISYSWGRQHRWACPTLAEADGTGGLPDLQSVMRRHNARR